MQATRIPGIPTQGHTSIHSYENTDGRTDKRIRYPFNILQGLYWNNVVRICING